VDFNEARDDGVAVASLYRCFPDNHFPGQMFPGQDVSGQDISWTRPFPDNQLS